MEAYKFILDLISPKGVAVDVDTYSYLRPPKIGIDHTDVCILPIIVKIYSFPP